MRVDRPEILIVGGGPIGLTIGINLRRYGVPCVIVERREKEADTSKGLMLAPASLHIFDVLGLTAPLLETAQKVANANLYWEGKRMYRLPFQHMATPFNYLVMQPQPITESVLKRRYLKLGGRYLGQTELVSLSMDGDQPIVEIRSQGGTSWERYPFVVAADGSKSTIREFLGIHCVEDRPEFMHFLLGDFVVVWKGGDLRESHYFVNEDGFMIVMPLKSGYSRVFFKGSGPCPNRSELTNDWFQKVAKAIAPKELSLSAPIWLSMVPHHTKVADQFRIGNVFLAGDAAHSFSPMGGQGMNTGIQDAFNLSWKLAFAYKNLGNEQLLDSYHVERHAVATDVSASVMANTRLICREDKDTNGRLKSFLPGRANLPFLRNVLPKLMSGLIHQYRSGALSGTPSDAAVGNWLGSMVPPASLAMQYQGLYSEKWFTLLVFNKTPLERSAIKQLNVLCTSLRTVLEVRLLGENESCLTTVSNCRWMGSLGQVASELFEVLDGTLMLVRPDLYVGCQCSIDEMYLVSDYLKSITNTRNRAIAFADV